MTEPDKDVSAFDVVIGGAGFAGLSLALALRTALGPRFAVAAPSPPPPA